MESLTLKPTPSSEEPLAGLEVGGAEHDVPEFAGPDVILAVDWLGPPGAAVGPPRPVLGGHGCRRLDDRVGDSDDDPDLGPGIVGRDGVRRSGWRRRSSCGEARRGRVEVVGIGRSDAELNDPPPR